VAATWEAFFGAGRTAYRWMRVFGHPANDETFISADIPMFVSEIIRARIWSKSQIELAFCAIFKILKQNNFWIVAFPNWVESTERPDQ
jgi:hypothetical protein